MCNNMKPSEAAAILGAIDPQSVTDANKVTTGFLGIKNFNTYAAVISAGAIATGGVINAKMQVSTDNSNWTDVTGTAITPLTDTDDNKQVWINLPAGQVQATLADADYIRLSVTTSGGGACLLSALLLGFSPAYAPASDFDATTVDEIVN